jgi:hypothetical protein
LAHVREHRVGSISALLGSALLLVGTVLHPTNADPNDSVAAFTEYAADNLWIESHLAQLAGIALMVAALLSLARQLEAESSGPWARFGGAGAVASLAIAAALQAVDGVALKTMVDAWVSAPVATKEIVLQGAFAVRQIEVGLASMLGLLLGVTVTLFGIALVTGLTYPRWLGWLAIVGGIPTTVAGVAVAFTGFSELAMGINMPASTVMLVWMSSIGVLMWRRREIPAA